MWYGSEIITHHDTMSRGEVDYDSCVTIHLVDITHEVSISIKFLQKRNLKKPNGRSFQRHQYHLTRNIFLICLESTSATAATGYAIPRVS